MTTAPNDSEALMDELLKTVTRWHIARGRVRSDGNPEVDAFQLLHVIAAVAGSTTRTAPTEMRQSILRGFVDDAARHAGYTAEVYFTPMQ